MKMIVFIILIYDPANKFASWIGVAFLLATLPFSWKWPFLALFHNTKLCKILQDYQARKIKQIINYYNIQSHYRRPSKKGRFYKQSNFETPELPQLPPLVYANLTNSAACTAISIYSVLFCNKAIPETANPLIINPFQEVRILLSKWGRGLWPDFSIKLTDSLVNNHSRKNCKNVLVRKKDRNHGTFTQFNLKKVCGSFWTLNFWNLLILGLCNS